MNGMIPLWNFNSKALAPHPLVVPSYSV